MKREHFTTLVFLKVMVCCIKVIILHIKTYWQRINVRSWWNDCCFNKIHITIAQFILLRYACIIISPLYVILGCIDWDVSLMLNHCVHQRKSILLRQKFMETQYIWNRWKRWATITISNIWYTLQYILSNLRTAYV